jgi:hypothetical protein
MASVPFYLDWQFWSAVAALSALILSQLPPLKQILKKGRVTIEKHGTLFLSHSIGSPSAHVFVILKNIGNTTTSVQSIDFLVKRKNSDSFTLKGRGYQINPSDQQFTMLVPFEIPPNKTWSHTINFIEAWNRDSQKEYKNIYIKIRDSINKKAQTPPIEHGVQHEADPIAYENICKFFKKNFKWLDGEYECEILVKNKVGEVITKGSVLFTLFESESDDLKSWEADYKYGYGVHLPLSPNQMGVWVELSG